MNYISFNVRQYFLLLIAVVIFVAGAASVYAGSGPSGNSNGGVESRDTYSAPGYTQTVTHYGDGSYSVTQSYYEGGDLVEQSTGYVNEATGATDYNTQTFTRGEGSDNTAPVTPGVSGSLPAISLSANRPRIYPDQVVQITWQGYENGKRPSCQTSGGFDGWSGQSFYIVRGNLLNGGNLYGKSSSHSTSRLGTYTFTITCQNGAFESGDWQFTTPVSRTVTVEVVPRPATCSLVASSSDITLGESTQLSWSATGTTAVGQITNNRDNTSLAINPRNASGTRTVTPTVSTMYTLTASSTGTSTVTCRARVNVDRNPTATISATNCEIPIGASSCRSLITWNIVDAFSPNVFRIGGGFVGATASGTDLPRRFSHGTTTLLARDVNQVLASTTVVASCAPTSRWDGSTCAVNPRAASSLDAAPCVILAGQSTCGSIMNWNIVGVTNPTIVNVTSGATYAGGRTVTNATRPIVYGRNTIEARDGANVIRRAFVVARCPALAPWNGTICNNPNGNNPVLPPTITLSAQSNVVRKLTRATLNWELSIPIPVGYTCTLNGPGLTNIPITTQNGSRLTGPIDNTSVFTLGCTNGLTNVSDSVTIEIVPPVQEV